MELYPADYYAHREAVTRRPTLRADLKRMVASEIYDLPLPHRFQSWQSWSKKLIAWLLRYQMRIPPPRQGQRRVLDVGCGNGTYLLWLRELGWECYGNEIDTGAVIEARQAGLDVFHGDLQQAGYPVESFDIINFSSVLDHTADPLGNLREAFRLLKPGGEIIAHCPNFASLQSQLFGQNWYNYIPPEHLYYFPPNTLMAIFEKAGFRVEKLWHKSPTNFLPHTLMYRTRARRWFNPLKEHYHIEPEWSILAKSIFAPFSLIQDALGRGETIYIQGRKPVSSR